MNALGGQSTRNPGCSQSALDDGDVAAVSKGVDIVVHQGPQGDGGFTSDYLTAVQSAAKRTLLPVSRGQSSSSLRVSGITGGLESGALLNNRGLSPAATASTSGALPPGQLVRQPSGREVEQAQGTYSGYVHLTLAGPPPSLPTPATAGQSSLPSPLVMHASASFAEATSAVVRRCLDKGFPFAVIPALHFASMMAAAEQHEGPLAYHILSTHCVYYPGMGRHAASSGGGPSPLSGTGTPTCNPAGGGGHNQSLDTGAASGPGRTSSWTAAEEAAVAVHHLLAGREPLHVLSPGEYQRIRLAAQFSLRELRDILVAQAPLPAATPPGPGGAQGAGPVTAAPGVPGGRVVRQHRRGSSICGESNFSAVVVRSQSGLEGLEGQVPDRTSAPVRAGAGLDPGCSVW